MSAMTLERQAKVRATALPMPEAVKGAIVTMGGGQQAVRLHEVEIGTRHLYAGNVKVYRACGRCGGAGYIYHYGHVYDGVCFECRGPGVRLYAETVEEAQRKVRSEQAAEMRRAAKEEIERPAREAAAAAWMAEQVVKAEVEAYEEVARRAAADAAFAAQRYAGEVGSKVTVEGTIVKVIGVESRYGYSRLVIVEGTGPDAGVTVKTFGTSAWHWDAEEGAAVKITATVKDHEVYNGTKQTQVIRPKGA